MPFSLTPSQVKALIPTASGSFCERFKKFAIYSGTVLNALTTYLFKEDGTPTDELQADICALPCALGSGGGSTEPPNPNMPAPQNLIASDDSFSDKIQISWDAVTAPVGIDPVTQYRLYRSTTTSFGSATLIATITAPTVVYDDVVDVDLAAGTNYHYWARSTNGTDTSAPSNRDQGRAATAGEIGVLPDISDLRVTYGLGAFASSLSLVWTPPAGSTKFDVYRHTSNVFGSATKIYSNVVPRATTFLNHDTSNPESWDNVGEHVLYHTPPSLSTDYYFWIVAKGDSPPSESDESNSGLGRGLPPSTYNLSSETLDFSTQSTVVPVGASKAWVVLQGSSGGGAGGGGVYGGGGGGGGGTVRFTLSGLTPGHAVTLAALSAANSGNAASETNGADGEVIELSVNAVLVGIANEGTGGVYNAGGDGDGGTGGDAGAPAGSPVVYNGADGMPSSGANGGRSGYLFGGRRMPMADGSVGGGFNGDGLVGSGAKAVPFNPTLSVGGYAFTGKAYITFGT